MLTIAECLKESILLNDESDSARLDTELLLARAINKDRTFLYTWPDKKLTAEEFDVFKGLLKRRLQGEPIAYILGEKEFWSRNFLVNSSTLIPRDDTECIVEYIITSIRNNVTKESRPLKVLDLGAGTGVIGITLALELPGSCVDAVDFNDNAVALAKKNASRLSVSNISIFQSDWFSSVSGLYDIIASNPPYIDSSDHHLDKGDLRFEPNSALIADQNGLADIRTIFKDARNHLVDGGFLLVEHGYNQGELVREIANEFAYSDIQTEKDLSENDRFCVARLVDSL